MRVFLSQTILIWSLTVSVVIQRRTLVDWYILQPMEFTFGHTRVRTYSETPGAVEEALTNHYQSRPRAIWYKQFVANLNFPTGKNVKHVLFHGKRADLPSAKQKTFFKMQLILHPVCVPYEATKIEVCADATFTQFSKCKAVIMFQGNLSIICLSDLLLSVHAKQSILSAPIVLVHQLVKSIVLS